MKRSQEFKEQEEEHSQQGNSTFPFPPRGPGGGPGAYLVKGRQQTVTFPRSAGARL